MKTVIIDRYKGMGRVQILDSSEILDAMSLRYGNSESADKIINDGYEEFKSNHPNKNIYICISNGKISYGFLKVNIEIMAEKVRKKYLKKFINTALKVNDRP